jgi:hypothetical protein
MFPPKASIEVFREILSRGELVLRVGPDGEGLGLVELTICDDTKHRFSMEKATALALAQALTDCAKEKTVEFEDE